MGKGEWGKGGRWLGWGHSYPKCKTRDEISSIGNLGCVMLEYGVSENIFRSKGKGRRGIVMVPMNMGGIPKHRMSQIPRWVGCRFTSWADSLPLWLT